MNLYNHKNPMFGRRQAYYWIEYPGVGTIFIPKNISNTLFVDWNDQLNQTSGDDKTTYSNYEEYVKRNFLESGGREELDADIDRAQMEHTLGL